MENSGPTIAAPTAATPTAPPPVAQKLAPKFAASASAWRPIVNPSRISAASAPVLTAVREVWMIAAVRTPRTLIQVRSATDATASRRWGERPTVTGPNGGGGGRGPPEEAAGERPGQNTAVKRANATATAAMVPVWITTNSVQP